ncbi:undecaprenyl-phosphate glucose phosphotransferase [Pluralibacter gergoviae]|nr:undecaprenyl-phosphate glucose phosphotransferase [Pluralibacter gergoviae]ELC3016771.1 undecaprenyl-phosphate glucose phosphotransferase [Pluralibacter gergoviae]ELC3022290.1 undecaprenyl-phosphate glucose phosphotransferase [Pluralibacter gergoviae]
MAAPRARSHSTPNASLISMVQRFSDISIIISGLYVVCICNEKYFGSRALLVGLIALVLFQMVGGITDFYRSWRGVKISTELKLLLQNWTLSLIFTSGVTSFLLTFEFSFTILSQWYFLVCLAIILCRVAIRFGAGVFRKLGYNTRNVAVAGSMPVGVSLIRSFQDEPWLGFIVKGIYDDNNVPGISYAGNLNDLICEAKAGKLDRIYIAMSMKDEAILRDLIKKLTNTTCSVMLIPDIFTFNILQSRTEEVNGVPVVPLFDTPLNGINMVFKRLEDIIISLLIVLFILPVLALISVVVKFSSPGPILFRQVRYGMDGKPIKVWKFRTMTVMENDNIIIQVTKNDSRVTSVGRFLRKTSLDELPQFFNVLKGEMSIVGPRPHAVAHNEIYRTLIDGYMLRHKVKPGITGLAQVKGWRGETDTLDKMQKRIEYDLEYIREWSLWLDLKIITMTIFKGFINKSAY